MSDRQNFIDELITAANETLGKVGEWCDVDSRDTSTARAIDEAGVAIAGAIQTGLADIADAIRSHKVI